MGCNNSKMAVFRAGEPPNNIDIVDGQLVTSVTKHPMRFRMACGIQKKYRVLPVSEMMEPGNQWAEAVERKNPLKKRRWRVVGAIMGFLIYLGVTIGLPFIDGALENFWWMYIVGFLCFMYAILMIVKSERCPEEAQEIVRLANIKPSFQEKGIKVELISYTIGSGDDSVTYFVMRYRFTKTLQPGDQIDPSWETEEYMEANDDDFFPPDSDKELDATLKPASFKQTEITPINVNTLKALIQRKRGVITTPITQADVDAPLNAWKNMLDHNKNPCMRWTALIFEFLFMLSTVILPPLFLEDNEYVSYVMWGLAPVAFGLFMYSIFTMSSARTDKAKAMIDNEFANQRMFMDNGVTVEAGKYTTRPQRSVHNVLRFTVQGEKGEELVFHETDAIELSDLESGFNNIYQSEPQEDLKLQLL
eukprot:TRINITY_DN12936_c1_g1_i8.p1 TRINITY_DN12936_c1_g1~~TRINITY_DN12936_c1_g1_i8.p1  ORF type:complete len:451 (-),score=126.75 TRINITY_DN12936_c1_g1_i8:2281-3537(-)